MIPPLPQYLITLPSNSQPESTSPYPQFAQSYHHLTTTLLDSDASTRKRNGTYNDVSTRLDEIRVQRAKERILIALLNDAAFSDADDSSDDGMAMQTDLADRGTVTSGQRQKRDLTAVIAEYLDYGLNGSGRVLSEYEYDLIAQDVETFKEQINEVVADMEKELGMKYELLYSIASASSMDGQTTLSQLSDRKRTQPYHQPAKLSDLISQQSSHLTQLRLTTLPKTQYSTINTLLTLLNLQSQYLETLIRHLELRIHGSEARNLISRAQFLSSVAQGMHAKLRVMYLEQRRDLYSPELRNVLERRMEVLDNEGAEVERRRRKLEEVWREYDSISLGNGGKIGDGVEVLRQLGKRYGEVEGEIEDVRRDIERLGREVVEQRPKQEVRVKRYRE